MQKLIRRRDFVKSLSISAAAALIDRAPGLRSTINKREVIMQLIAGNPHEWYVPAGFFVHFGDSYRWGNAAVKRHLEYFTAIDMDFIKVQYEQTFPVLHEIKRPADWRKMPFYGKDFYRDQLYVVKELVKKGKSLAPVIVTLYSPFMCAGHSIGSQLLTEHLKQDPENVKKGMEMITDSVMVFAKECIKLGVDGFLASTQGGEAFRFDDASIFLKYVKPHDLTIMNEINADCHCNILHVCDYEGGYNDLAPFLDYPGQIVNCSTKLGNGTLSPKELGLMFKRPFMGGLEKNGPITSGNIDQVQQTASEVLSNAPTQFIIGAECALLGEVDWKKVRKVVDMAHSA
ncbi:MAG: hypothetical protein IPL46_14415 [Saprospiraceae bacterium]|nr:hypothetical protein [Saprospiraceae bacterium]